MWSEPEVAPALWVVGDDGGRLALDGERSSGGAAGRGTLAAASWTNWCLRRSCFGRRIRTPTTCRFRDEDLAAFAASFGGQPFLGTINTLGAGGAGGTIRGSALAGRELLQRVALTVPHDMEAFLNGQMDRFSIAWYRGERCCVPCAATSGSAGIARTGRAGSTRLGRAGR